MGLFAALFGYFNTAEPVDFLRSCSGVIHVGANSGQERELYARYGLNVVWIEPIPEVYVALADNIVGYPSQTAINALITDKDGETYTLHVANNEGASSSILDLHDHRDIWPDVHYVRDIVVFSATLPAALHRAGVSLRDYDALVMDTQGSELLVLRGAAPMLRGFKWIKTEAADFEAYKGCTTVSELVDYLRPFGFRLHHKDQFATRTAGGAYFDILFKR